MKNNYYTILRYIFYNYIILSINWKIFMKFHNLFYFSIKTQKQSKNLKKSLNVLNINNRKKSNKINY